MRFYIFSCFPDKRRRLKRQSKVPQFSSDEMLSDSKNNEENDQFDENMPFPENHEIHENMDDWDEEYDEDDDEDLGDIEESNQNDNNENSNEDGSDISVTGYENKKLTKRQWMSRNTLPDGSAFHMQLPDKKPRKKRTLLMTEEQQIKKMEKVLYWKFLLFFLISFQFFRTGSF